MTARMARAIVMVVAVAVQAATGVSASQAPGPKASPPPPAHTPGAGPVVVVETTKGTFEFETYPDEAPRTVEHILNLVNKGFYNGLRVHRAEPGFVIQVGDPNTRDYTKKDIWGTGGSGTPVGVSELSRKHRHVKGAVAMAHRGNPAQADAQFYVMLNTVPRLDGKYVVFGQVIGGEDVPAKIRVGDVIRKMYVRP